MQPMINVLIALYDNLLHNFGITIIVLTIIIRFLTLPLTLKQLRSTKAVSSLQPKIMELQKKYAKDKQKLAQEQMRLYKESGISPMGCTLPMLVQMPVWIALYQAIILTLAISPEGTLNLARYLYDWPFVYSLLPLNNAFLWLDLAKGDTVIAILVGASMWLQQKMVTPSSADPRAQAQGRMMLWMMPLMFAFLSLSFPSGLALYWVVSNVITIVIQYYITGWGGLAGFLSRTPMTQDQKFKQRVVLEGQKPEKEEANKGYFKATEVIEEPSADQKEGPDDGEEPGDKREDRGGSYPTRIRQIRHRPRKPGDNRPKRR